MPDFEALIRHQQLKQPKANQRLKVVDSPEFEKEDSVFWKPSNLIIELVKKGNNFDSLNE